MSIYELKPKFQDLLRPLVKRLYAAGITANQITLLACAISIILGAILVKFSHISALFWLLPAWMFARMALNAIDGMLAREFNQKSNLGGYLNELTDVVADAALYLPFAFVAPLGLASVFSVIYLAALSELAGILGAVHGHERRYDGPMGKSDRAFIFGALGLVYALSGSLGQWACWLVWAVAAALVLTCVRRVRSGLAGGRR